MSWGEFVHITAEYFEPGEHPWTTQDFYAHSVLQHEAPATVRGIVQTLWEHEGPRVAERDGWWDTGVWWGLAGTGYRFEQYLPLDDDLKLTAPAVRFHFLPLTTSTGDREEPSESMLAWEINGGGEEETFWRHLDEIKQLCDGYRKGNSYIALLTLWFCESGWSYIPGEPSEYESDWQLLGAVTPHASGVAYKGIAQ